MDASCALAHYVRKDAEPSIVNAGGKGDTLRVGTLSLLFSSIQDSDDNIMELEYVVEPPDGINIRLYLYERTDSGKAWKFGSWMNMNDVANLAFCAKSMTGTAYTTHRGVQHILVSSALRGVFADYIITSLHHYHDLQSEMDGKSSHQRECRCIL